MKILDDAMIIDSWSKNTATGAFEDTMRKVAERALKRYPQPAGIDPGWKVDVNFMFTME